MLENISVHFNRIWFYPAQSKCWGGGEIEVQFKKKFKCDCSHNLARDKHALQVACNKQKEHMATTAGLGFNNFL